MKPSNWLQLLLPLLLLALPALFARYSSNRIDEESAPIWITAMISATVCFLAITGLLAWERWVHYQKKIASDEKTGPLENTLRLKEEQVVNLQKALDVAEEKVRKAAQPLVTEEKRLLDLAEKLRTRTTVKDGATTTDEVPAEIRDFITKNFPKS